MSIRDEIKRFMDESGQTQDDFDFEGIEDAVRAAGARSIDDISGDTWNAILMDNAK